MFETVHKLRNATRRQSTCIMAMKIASTVGIRISDIPITEIFDFFTTGYAASPQKNNPLILHGLNALTPSKNNSYTIKGRQNGDVFYKCLFSVPL